MVASLALTHVLLVHLTSGVLFRCILPLNRFVDESIEADEVIEVVVVVFMIPCYIIINMTKTHTQIYQLSTALALNPTTLLPFTSNPKT